MLEAPTATLNMPRPNVAAPSVFGSIQKSSRTRTLEGPSLLVDHVLPAFSLVKTPTEVAEYSQLGLTGWRFTSNTGASGWLPVTDDHVAPPSCVCHRLFATNPVYATITLFALPALVRMRL